MMSHRLRHAFLGFNIGRPYSLHSIPVLLSLSCIRRYTTLNELPLSSHVSTERSREIIFVVCAMDFFLFMRSYSTVLLRFGLCDFVSPEDDRLKNAIVDTFCFDQNGSLNPFRQHRSSTHRANATPAGTHRRISPHRRGL